MKIVKAIIILIFSFYPLIGYPNGEYRNPFTSLLPGEKARPKAKAKEVDLPALSIEGVLWGNDKHQAIISGEVYSVGDKLKGLNAKIIKIEKNTVFISFGDKVYERKITKRTSKRRRRRR